MTELIGSPSIYEPATRCRSYRSRDEAAQMADQTLFLQSLSEFVQTLLRPYEIGDVLYELVGKVSGVLDLAGAGVSLSVGGSMRFVTGLNEASVHLEAVQEQCGEGPCTSAFEENQIILAPRLVEEARWPQFKQAALGAGFQAVAAVPMVIEDRRALGALNLYAATERDWSGEDIAVAQVMANMATGYIVHSYELAEMTETTTQLREALNSRIVIEQAKGILAAERKISLDAAYQLMRRHSRNHSASLHSVAEAVVNLGLRP